MLRLPADYRQVERTYHSPRAARRNNGSWGVLSVNGERLPCTVLDTSATGARIKLESARTLAGRVQLLGLGGAEPREATVVWCRGGQAGLCFVGQDLNPGYSSMVLAAIALEREG